MQYWRDFSLITPWIRCWNVVHLQNISEKETPLKFFLFIDY